ncbi:hypothetical protein [Caballeronia novacaledonica]|uniref:Uncharacterized protein n=1 Tax=Caballeronia novacaledonica TaxID=1544861 RepID=A0AA37MS66_9BURK|nr:hypothetical protein [Caballeronia novacaledonica]GJH25379.1 hypothetical protein CBA19CS42_12705 [Caballeronia novacaledonica]
MDSAIPIAVIAAASALTGGLLTSGANFFLSRRQTSRSGARLLADLQILEKARALSLDKKSMDALEDYIRERVEWHTHTK